MKEVTLETSEVLRKLVPPQLEAAVGQKDFSSRHLVDDHVKVSRAAKVFTRTIAVNHQLEHPALLLIPLASPMFSECPQSVGLCSAGE